MATAQETEPPNSRDTETGPDVRNGVSANDDSGGTNGPEPHADEKLNYCKPANYEQHPVMYENNQPAPYGYPYPMQQQQQQSAELYHYSQYPIPRPGSYPAGTMPRPAGNANYSPYSIQTAPGGRYPTPTLNQLLQPGAPPNSGHRYPYPDYPPQQQQQSPAWPPMQQQPRGYSPHSMQYKPPLPAQGPPHTYPYGLAPNSQPGYAPSPPVSSAPSAQDGAKDTNETNATVITSSSSSNSSPNPVASAASAAAAALSPNNTSAGSGAAAAASPAPSPASRSMSPALGQANNTSPSGQADSTGQTRTTQSPMAAQGAYQHPMPPPPHVGLSPYKMGGGPGSPAPSIGPYPPQQAQQYPYMGRPPMGPSPYGPSAGSYGPPPAGATPPSNNANSVSPGPRPPMPPHMGPPPPNPYGSYPAVSVGGTPPGMNQYVQQQPNWGPPPNAPHPGGPPTHPGAHPPGKNMPMVGSRPHTPTHYNLKQHIQAKMGYSMAPSPTSGGPPPAQGPPSQQMMGPYPPNGSAMNNSGLPSPGMGVPPQGHPPSASSPVANVVTTGPDGAPLDDGSQQSTLSNTSAASGDDQSMPSTPRSRKEVATMSTSTAHHPHTFSHPSTPQSSVASPGAASSTHEDYGDVHSPASGTNWNIPHRAAPPSPVCNSHTGNDPYKPKKSGGPGDAMARLYEFDDNPDRKMFVDRLLRFMEEKGSPIAACPTISKNPLDLFRLYHLVRERGGFLEVTKSKAWKDVASSLGIGASSSAAYTLRKHYTKNLLPFECKFDRGGIDPRPLIDQVETSAKKKPVAKGGLSVPSPAGSSNSQDSFPPPMDGYSNYPGYPPPPHVTDNIAASNPFDDQYNRGGVPNSYPPPPPHPPSMYNNMGVRPSYPNQAPYSSYQNDYSQPQPGQPYPPYGGPQNRSMYGPPYSEPYGHQGPPPPGGAPPPPAAQGWGAAPGYPPRHPAPPPPVSVAASAPPAPVSTPTPPATVSSAGPTPVVSSQPATPTPGLQAPPPPVPPQQQQQQQPQQSSSAGPSPSPSPAPSATPTFPEQNEQYQKSGLRQLLASSTLAQQLAATPPDRPGYPGNQQQPAQPYASGMTRPNSAAPASNMPSRQSTPTPTTPSGAPPAPPGPGPAQQGPYPGYGPPGQPQPGQQPRPGYEYYGYRPPYGTPESGGGAGVASGGWRGAAPYPNQYPPQGSSPGPIQTGAGPWVPPTGSPAPRPGWDQQQPRFSSAPAAAGAPPQTYNGAPQQWNPSMANARPYAPMPRPPYRPDGKPYAMPPVPVKAGMGPMQGPAAQQMYSMKRDVYFPPDSVEAVMPVHAKRRRLCKPDVAPIDAWRIYLALKSGLLAESTWAIDVLNILLFDDSTVSYFGLAYLPGLLEVLLEHFRRCLAEIFGILEDMEICYERAEEYRAKVHRESRKEEEEEEKKDEEESWWLVSSTRKSRQRPDQADNVDLGSVKASDLEGDRVRVLDQCVAFSVRRGEKVGVVNRDKDIFIMDTRKDWDIFDGFDSGVERWQIGGGDTTQHIVTHFQAELGIVPFVRVLADKKHNHPESADTQVSSQDADTCEKTSRSATTSSGETLPADLISDIKKEAVEEADESPSDEKPAAVEQQQASGDPGVKREFQPQVRDLHGSLKRRRMEDYEDECYVKDESSLHLLTDTQDNLSRRCIALSNILRSLSFVPGNESELAKNPSLLVTIGKLLLLYHDHNVRSTNQKNYDREEDVDFFTSEPSSQSSTSRAENEWWWDTLLALRENVLVLLANVSGQLDLSQYSEEIARPIIDGLLHWAVCPSAQAQDPFPSFGPHSTSLLSPNRLSLEALCKLCVVEANTDLILATPPFTRLEKLVGLLTRYLCRTEDQVLREFAINLLYNFSAADTGMARLIGLSNNSLALLVAFVEQAEGNALAIANQHGIQALRENPEAMGTSLDMLRRAAWTLYHIAGHPDSRQLLAKLEQRLLALVMSQIMDQSVAALLSKSLYLCNSDSD